MDFLTTRSVVKQFHNHLALDRVSISVPENTIFGLLGPNGAGKTTLIRIINQITAPDEGEVLINGKPIRSSDVSLIGYLPEERGLYKKMKVGEQSLYLAQLKGLSRQEAMKRLKYWFEKFEMTAWWNKKIEELSKGMAQKVQFVTTIVHEPPLLIFDEPFSGFDPINANMLKNEILELKEKGSTIIFSTHNMASVEELCDNIALINKSRLILDGRIDDIRKAHRTNTYELGFEGNAEGLQQALAQDYELGEVRRQNGLMMLRIRARAAADTNKLLASLLPLVEVHSFNEVIPGMNDVFIRMVNETNHNRHD
jgi:ABC-2 type transport system ATP-binding protein